MTLWDSAALNRLEQLCDSLGRAGLTDAVQEEVGDVWRANLQRHEPSVMGDTDQTLAWHSAVNIAQRLARRFPLRTDLEDDDRPDVAAKLTGVALAIHVDDVTIRLRKAPGNSLDPDLSALTWEESDGVRRHQAADDNCRAYRPSRSDQAGRPQALDDGLWSINDPAGLRNLMLIWAGDAATGLTAGWVGFPSLGQPSWFAVRPIWRDQPPHLETAPVAPTRPSGPDDSFAARPEPTPILRPRPRPGQERRP